MLSAVSSSVSSVPSEDAATVRERVRPLPRAFHRIVVVVVDPVARADEHARTPRVVVAVVIEARADACMM